MNKTFFGVIGSIALSASLVAAGLPQDASAATSWKMNSGAQIQWDKISKNVKNPSFIRGNLSSVKVNNENEVKKFITENKDIFQIKNEEHLKLIDQTKDDLGITHYVFQPTIQGVPISNSQYMVHVDKDGTVLATNGELHADAPEKVEQSKKLSSKEAIQSAWSQIDVDQKDVKETIKTKKGSIDVLAEKSDLVVYHENGTYTLAYHVQLQFANPEPGNWQVWVNAANGKVLKAVNQVHEATGTGTGVLGDTKTINTTLSDNQYQLIDSTKPMNGSIYTMDNENGTQANLPGKIVTDADNNFNSERHKAAVDAHYYAGEVFDYYYETFDRVSYDNQGADIISSVHFGNDYNNAAWVGNQMIYGDGDGQTFAPLSGSLDVIAHELTHAVTSTEADLVYQSQPGALNESFSDVFGYFLDTEDWLLGEDVYTPGVEGDALRSLSDPTKYNQPDHMSEYQDLPVTREGDWGGVHINSGIPNKAAYHTINDLGVEKSQQVYYRALTEYLTPNSNFADAKQALMQSATDLYGSSAAKTIETAWGKVGL
ncbi:M4 family metallopeptidase [Pseudalkalibacillus decolorationis]|uniref:M4 family metallopeptidase n=1 Tax=Pseudalkalibacillus decolorationis TaxID=163879 RepID=UPI00214978B3|nr:M4 family metallopeptidase [Pseudalkalibacillus decolorationis]